MERLDNLHEPPSEETIVIDGEPFIQIADMKSFLADLNQTPLLATMVIAAMSPEQRERYNQEIAGIIFEEEYSGSIKLISESFGDKDTAQED
ncbi:hypothetical protein M1563_05015 [Patescibacteria group bacterium]|nr:hypothetical protein [Patescibacteria group bacterium]MCL5409440.1 hypothetical protein [Patescibacteria group bacterium]